MGEPLLRACARGADRGSPDSPTRADPPIVAVRPTVWPPTPRRLWPRRAKSPVPSPRGPWSRPGHVLRFTMATSGRSWWVSDWWLWAAGQRHVGRLGRPPDRPDPRDRGARSDGGYAAYGLCGLPYYVSGLVEQGRAASCLPARVLPRAATDRPAPARHGTALDPDRRVVQFSHDGREHRLHYHRLVVAAGGGRSCRRFPASTTNEVFTIRTLEDAIALALPLDAGRIGRALVVGAGYIGLEMVEALVDRGVTVVRGRGTAAGDAEPRRAGCRLVEQGAPPRRRSAARRPARGFAADGRPRALIDGDTSRPARWSCRGCGQRRSCAAAGRAPARAVRCSWTTRMRTSLPDVYAMATASRRSTGSSAGPPSCRWVRPRTGPGRGAGTVAAGGTPASRGSSARRWSRCSTWRSPGPG